MEGKATPFDVRRIVFPVSRSIWLGPFASPQRLSTLVAAGITHILNVGEAPSVLAANDGPFREIAWHPIVDLERMPDESAINCLLKLHGMLCEREARVYVHCIAGLNRSPTIVWLYMVACGIDPDAAKRMITRQAQDAVPGHARLVDTKLIERIRGFGIGAFLPHPRLDALDPPDGDKLALP